MLSIKTNALALPATTLPAATEPANGMWPVNKQMLATPPSAMPSMAWNDQHGTIGIHKQRRKRVKPSTIGLYPQTDNNNAHWHVSSNR
jgi:hypothetical protein